MFLAKNPETTELTDAFGPRISLVLSPVLDLYPGGQLSLGDLDRLH
jgi:hypothetical protein